MRSSKAIKTILIFQFHFILVLKSKVKSPKTWLSTICLKVESHKVIETFQTLDFQTFDKYLINHLTILIFLLLILKVFQIFSNIIQVKC
jgi:hypothetical protein